MDTEFTANQEESIDAGWIDTTEGLENYRRKNA